MSTVVGLVVRITLTYVFLLALMRLAGKRTFKEATPFDFLVALIIGDCPDDIIWGEVPVAQGLVAMASIAMLHVAVSYACYRSRWFDQLLASRPTVLIRDGELVRPNLARERLNDVEVARALRHHGLADMRAIREARLEPSSVVTVTLRDADQPARKRDRQALNSPTG